MNPRNFADEDTLQVLACEIERRPSAPTVSELVPLVLGVARSDQEIAVSFPTHAVELVEAFAAAERICCAGIRWQVETGSNVLLRIGANELALDAIAQMFPVTGIEKVQ
jgi:hypothetical protein